MLASFRTWRNREIAGLMLYCGVRSAEALGLDVTDVDIGGRWVQLTGKGNRKALDAADVVVLDLEDAVPAANKSKAREALLSASMDPRPGSSSG